jgi:endoglycosylceramidase
MMRTSRRTRTVLSRRHFLATAITTTLAGITAARAHVVPAKPLLRVSGRRFVDSQGRVVILRGINLAGDAKVPPFNPLDNPSDLDRLLPLGFNVVRLVFIWEAFESSPGTYDQAYLARMRWIAEHCWARGLFVIVDLHQDGFARNLARGSGDGFPLWAASPLARTTTPNNGPDCKDWPVRMATDLGMHQSWSQFYADKHGVRSRYLAMLRAIAPTFRQVPGVIGYDLINEPWGQEPTEIAPLYEDAARVIRAQDPSAILFVEGHVTTNAGIPTTLPRPGFDNFAYAPHYYMPSTILRKNWLGGVAPIDRAFANMSGKAAEWNVPLFVGEFGAPAEAKRVEGYIDAIYDRLDSATASGAQWNYTPHWDPVTKDGWNGEDFTVLDPQGRLRPNYRLRPYPRTIAGEPIRFGFLDGLSTPGRNFFELTWNNQPDRGETEIFLPADLFPRGSALSFSTPEARAWREESNQLLIATSPRPGPTTLRIVCSGTA